MAMLIGLLASSGLRSGEVVRLDRSDVDLTNGVLLVRKTKFRRIVSFRFYDDPNSASSLCP
ncbi:tyrosine-type recombinase/integrase [Sinorhizobium meliloti]|uniref:tyrosine-type recombinase/integrase n=1 Tax=Rhizobium meliloti TaxID=382 RepID=UPI0013154D45|nr:tyrosine-type recombinase/integrase [Sinorhizobium meliloti]